MLAIARVVMLSLPLLTASFAHAGEVAKLAEEAEGLIAKGDGPAAYDKMRQSLAAASAGIPFDIRKAFFRQREAADVRQLMTVWRATSFRPARR
ncbi:MAG: hypothetical protein KL863_18210 [Rhizobium sp.]|nr:hypothetical protein [Rhizobium sp.]